MHQVVSVRLEYLNQLHEIVKLTERLLGGDQSVEKLLKMHLKELEPRPNVPGTWTVTWISGGKSNTKPDLDEIDNR